MFGLSFGGGSSKNSYNKSGESTSTPIVPAGWQGSYDDWMNFIGPLAMDSGSQDAINYFTNSGNNNPYNSANTSIAAGQMNDELQGQNSWRYNLLTGKQPSLSDYAAPKDVSSRDVSVGGVSAGTGADFMGAYANPFNTQVKDATLQDILHGGQVAANDLVAKYGGSGAYGGGGMGVALGELGGDVARQYGSAAANLNREGFNTALGAGQTDASRNLSALQGNQATDASLAQANAARDLAAQQFNASMLNQRGMFGVNTAQANNAYLQGIINDMSNTTQGRIGNMMNMGQVAGNDFLNAAGLSSQQVQQYLQSLGIGTSTFGEQTNYSEQGQSKGSNMNFGVGFGKK